MKASSNVEHFKPLKSLMWNPIHSLAPDEEMNNLYAV